MEFVCHHQKRWQQMPRGDASSSKVSRWCHHRAKNKDSAGNSVRGACQETEQMLITGHQRRHKFNSSSLSNSAWSGCSCKGSKRSSHGWTKVMVGIELANIHVQDNTRHALLASYTNMFKLSKLIMHIHWVKRINSAKCKCGNEDVNMVQYIGTDYPARSTKLTKWVLFVCCPMEKEKQASLKSSSSQNHHQTFTETLVANHWG